MSITKLEQRDTGNLSLDHVAKLSTASAGTVLTLSILPELNTARYGFTGYLAQSEDALNFFRHVLEVALLVTLLAWSILYIKHLKMPHKSHHQLVWLPFIISWALAAVFASGVTRVGLTTWLTAGALLTTALMTPFLALIPGHAFFLLKCAVRLLVFGSTITAVFWPDRAYAPYVIWPGGWHVNTDRLQGLLPHPNLLGWVAALAICVEIVDRRSYFKLIWVGLHVFILYETGSRTATICITIALMAGLIARYRRSNGLIFMTMAAILIAFSSLAYFVATNTEFTLAILNGRESTWRGAWNAFLANPLIGVGPQSNFGSTGGYAHNQLLQTLAATGILGFAALTVHMVILSVLLKKSNFNTAAVISTTIWITSFVSENMLRIASVNFAAPIVLMQLAVCALFAYEHQTEAHKR